ncbi:ankyrin [Lindgomyces ingoldianus]|uniref:Ankyrin n=1 Tax=Lindgomyces ingoldianus TaxID=673940 RepID=A0ACB6Q9I1_9PLEO|nr:ankyrin [Lindgomyces ingoldianus]KAF2463609.1 ankyrin [Lindgomyces ingoldianus]
MELIDLPPEIIREILVHAVKVRGIKRGLRLRLINPYFATEVLQALYQTDLLEDLVENKGLKRSHDTWHIQFWRSYLVHKITVNRDPKWGSLNIILHIAKYLCEQTGREDDNTLRVFVTAMCYRPYRLLEHERRCRRPFHADDVKNPRYLLQAAIVNRCPRVVQKILDASNTPATILDPKISTDVLGTPSLLAGEYGDHTTLSIIFKSTFRRLDEKREEALSGAVRQGRLDNIQYILDFGPVNFISSSHTIENGLLSGTMKSLVADFPFQLYSLLRERHSERYPILCDTPEIDISELLDDVARYSSRTDIIENLLDAGAVLQSNVAPRDQTHYPSRHYPDPADPRWPWNALRRAVIGTNEKTVQLLLSRGADPNSTDDDVLWHASSSGCLGIVRMLLDHGAEVDRVPKPPRTLDTNRLDSPFVRAVLLEHTKMCLFLLKRGASLKASGEEALRRASEEGLESMVQFLINHGVRANLECVKAAVKAGNYKLANLFLASMFRK